VTRWASLGLLGFVVFAAGYLSMLGTEFVVVLPFVAHSWAAAVRPVTGHEISHSRELTRAS